jgi:hypothetical protein
MIVVIGPVLPPDTDWAAQLSLVGKLSYFSLRAKSWVPGSGLALTLGDTLSPYNQIRWLLVLVLVGALLLVPDGDTDVPWDIP